jgi:hypothetical protein
VEVDLLFSSIFLSQTNRAWHLGKVWKLAQGYQCFIPGKDLVGSVCNIKAVKIPPDNARSLLKFLEKLPQHERFANASNTVDVDNCGWLIVGMGGRICCRPLGRYIIETTVNELTDITPLNVLV